MNDMILTEIISEIETKLVSVKQIGTMYADYKSVTYEETFVIPQNNRGVNKFTGKLMKYLARSRNRILGSRSFKLRKCDGDLYLVADILRCMDPTELSTFDIYKYLTAVGYWLDFGDSWEYFTKLFINDDYTICQINDLFHKKLMATPNIEESKSIMVDWLERNPTSTPTKNSIGIHLIDYNKLVTVMEIRRVINDDLFVYGTLNLHSETIIGNGIKDVIKRQQLKKKVLIHKSKILYLENNGLLEISQTLYFI